MEGPGSIGHTFKVRGTMNLMGKKQKLIKLEDLLHDRLEYN